MSTNKTLSITAEQAAFELLRRETNKQRVAAGKVKIKAQNSLAMSMTKSDLLALTQGAALVTTPAPAQVIASKSAPKNRKVATPEAHTPKTPAKRGPKPLNDAEKTALRNEIYARYQPTWKVTGVDGLTGKAHYQAECEANGIITRASLRKAASMGAATVA